MSPPLPEFLKAAERFAAEMDRDFGDTEIANKYTPMAVAYGLLMFASKVVGAATTQAFVVTRGKPLSQAEALDTMRTIHGIVAEGFAAGAGNAVINKPGANDGKA